jgi:hypothetical protein
MLFSIGLAGGILSSFFGGYIAGRIAKSAELAHAAVIGAVIAVLRFGFALVVHGRHPRLWGYSLAIAGLEFACAVFGGWLANWRNGKSNQVVEPTRALSGARGSP